MDPGTRLMERVRARDVAAFEALYDGYHRLVFGIGLRMLGNAAFAEDFTQAVFLKAWSLPETFRGGSFVAWIARVARNHALDVLGARGARPETELPDARLPLDGAADDELAARSDAARVRDALAALPAEQRTLIETGYFDGVTHQELARRSGATLETLTTRIAGGLHAMRKTLAYSVAVNAGQDASRAHVALYALGVMSAAESQQTAGVIRRDPAARAEYDQLREVVDAIALVAEEPVDSARSARMRERLLARIRPTRGRASLVAVFWGVGLAAAASIAFGVVTVIQDLTIRSDLAAAQRRVANLQGLLRQSERVTTTDRQMLADMLAPDAKRYPVPPGTIIVRGRRILLALSHVPPPPRGHVYQVWTAAKGSTTMTPSVTFVPNADGVAVVPLPVDATTVGTVALSVEPEGGSKTPTTTPTFVRALT